MGWQAERLPYNNFCHAVVDRSLEKKSPPENYGKEDQTTVAAFLPWRGS